MRSGPLHVQLGCPHSGFLLSFILFYTEILFLILVTWEAALTQVSLGLSGENNKSVFVDSYHDIIIILHGAPSACVVRYFI